MFSLRVSIAFAFSATVPNFGQAQDFLQRQRQAGDAPISRNASAVQPRALEQVGTKFVGEIRWRGEQDICLEGTDGQFDAVNAITTQCEYGLDSHQFWYNADDYKPQIKWGTNPSKCLTVQDQSITESPKLKILDCVDVEDAGRYRQVFDMNGYNGLIQWEGATGRKHCLELENGIVGSSSKLVMKNCHSVGDADYVRQQWIAYDGGNNAKCSIAINVDECDKTAFCTWCQGPVANCYNHVLLPYGCAE